jgi:hypothetical protein
MRECLYSKDGKMVLREIFSQIKDKAPAVRLGRFGTCGAALSLRHLRCG